MQNTISYFHRLSMVIFLVAGLIFAPIMPQIAWAEEAGVGAAGAGSAKPPTGAAGGASVGVDVSGSTVKTTPAGKGALAPPEEVTPAPQTPPVKSAEQKTAPKGIGASAGTAGTAGAETGGGVKLGWKIAGGVLGVGLLLGLAGSGGGSGGGSTPTH